MSGRLGRYCRRHSAAKPRYVIVSPPDALVLCGDCPFDSVREAEVRFADVTAVKRAFIRMLGESGLSTMRLDLIGPFVPDRHA